jgi:DEAD/DEAH box helicase domain-containing protein
LPRAAQGAFAYNAVFQLLSWLVTPVAPGGLDGAAVQLQRNALWLGYLTVPPNADDLAVAKNEMATWLQQLPAWLQTPGNKHVPSMSRKDAAPMLLSWWPLACVDGKLDNITAPGVLVLDDIVDQSEKAPHLNWRRWLQLFNTLQTLPGMLATTTSGIQAGDLEVLIATSQKAAAPAGSADQVILSQDWTDVIQTSIEALRLGLRTLAGLGAIAPVVGHELADARGLVVAEAELAWPAQHLVLLTFGQSDLADVWRTAGWKPFVLDEADATVGGETWTESVRAALGFSGTQNSDSGEIA